jgi:hypothetical protein
VHDADDVLKPRVLGGWIHPPGGLELMNLPQTLDPSVVDDFTFRDFVARRRRPRHERYVAVNGVVAEVFALKISHGPDLTPLVTAIIGGAQALRRALPFHCPLDIPKRS